jgi:putative MATE family efflux protein
VRQAMLHNAILPTLLKLALPTMSVLIAQTAVNVAETYYVGLLGTDALAGVALVFPVFMLMMTMAGGGLGSGVSSAMARAVGAGNQHDADAIVLHAIILAALIGGLFTAGALWGGVALYGLLGGEAGAHKAAVEYSNYLFVGSIPVWIVNQTAAALRGAGNVRVPATVILIGAFVLIPASPALIFGFGPIPRLGIAGAGVAFALYYGCAMVVLLGYMASGRSGLSLRILRLEWRLFADILRVGIPAALSTVQMNMTVILVTGAFGLFGTSALAGYGVAARLDYILIPLLFGLSSAVLTMVGVNMGGGNADRAKRIAWIGSALGASMTEAIGLVVAFLPMLWIQLFTQDPDVVASARVYLQTVAPVYGFLGFGFTISYAAQGAGHMLWPFIAMAVRMCIAAGIGWFVVVRLHAGIEGLSLVVALSLVAFAAVCAIVMASKSVWKVTGPTRSI